MGTVKKIAKVKLIAGILFNEKFELNEILKLLSDNLGETESISKIFTFQHTKYYQKEMGENISRFYLSFKKLVEPDELNIIKLKTNKIEKELSKGNKRNINIDPGYIELGKLVLASTKNYSHRIYIGKGIFAEPTLHFFKGTFTKWPFSYPDYSSKETIDFFNQIREIYKIQLNPDNVLAIDK